MTPQMTQELFREKITLVKKIVKEWNPPYSYVTKHDIEALLWGLDRQADLIRRLKETLNDYDRVSNDLARFAYHAVSCVKRSPHVACSDVCDCGYIKAAREHAALHTALMNELEKREHVQD